MQTTDYNKQAEDFLAKFRITFRATLSDSKLPPWDNNEKTHAGGGKVLPMDVEKPRHHYRVTLSKRTATGSHGAHCFCMDCSRPSRLTFDFWGSIADAQKGQTTVTPYDVLACISGDVHCAETFEEFCSEFGESADSIKALQTFRRCSAFAKRLRQFFTAEEIEALSEIN